MFDLVLLAAAAGLLLALLLAEFAGRRVALRSRSDDTEAEANRERTGHLVTSIFGLLALLLGFSFGIVLNRYDTRRADVVAEANAISTAHYHAGFLPGQAGAALQQNFEQYARNRLEYGLTGPFGRDRLDAEAGRIRSAIASAGQQVAPLANSPLGSLVLSDTTAVLDMGVQREANIRAKLPMMVFAVLVGLAIAGAGMMGFAYPQPTRNRQATNLSLFALLTLTIGVIVDLDRPAGGTTRVDQTPMRQLGAELTATAAQTPAPDMAGTAQNGRTPP